MLAWPLPCPALPAEALSEAGISNDLLMSFQSSTCATRPRPSGPGPSLRGKWPGVGRGCLGGRDTQQAGPWAWGSLSMASHKLLLSL